MITLGTMITHTNTPIKVLRQLSKQPSLAEVIDLIMANRGLAKSEDKKLFLKPKPSLKLSVSELGFDSQKLAKAADKLAQSIRENKSILIYGDYDADGICATAIMWLSLRRFFGHQKVVPFIPNREDHGYGLNPLGLQAALVDKAEATELVITVDNGIVAFEGVEYLNQAGLEVVITDHHQPAQDGSLPATEWFAHSTEISGSAVAWAVVSAVANKLNLDQADIDQWLTQLLDLVALGSIADVMPMIGVNRSLVVDGLAQLTKSQRPGIVALKQVSGIKDKALMSSYHVGYILGPRLNASGRIDDAMNGLRLLCTGNLSQARELAEVLNTVNQERKDLTHRATEHAFQLYEASTQLQQQRIIVMDDELFHEGIVGLIAGKLVERYQKPAIVLAKSGQQAKGSARSISTVSIIDLIREHQDLLIAAGGHKLAAGVSLEVNQIDQFRQQINQTALEQLDEAAFASPIEVETILPLELITQDLYRQIEKLQPFGTSNPRPKFVSRVILDQVWPLGSSGMHYKARLRDWPELELVAFNQPEFENQIEMGVPFDLVYSIGLNTWRGKQTLQLQYKG